MAGVSQEMKAAVIKHCRVLEDRPTQWEVPLMETCIHGLACCSRKLDSGECRDSSPSLPLSLTYASWEIPGKGNIRND